MDNPAPAMDATWLVKLEERVERAVAEIGRLRQENRRLERELARAKKAGAATADAAAWERERTEVKGRVEQLAKKLEELLGDGASALLEPPSVPAVASAADDLAADDEEPSKPLVQRTLEPVD